MLSRLNPRPSSPARYGSSRELGLASSENSASAAMSNAERNPSTTVLISSTGIKLGVPPPKNTVVTGRLSVALRQSCASLINACE